MPRRLKATYDAAGYDRDNEKHWAYAGGHAADASANPEARRKIRNRARYEVLENNSYGKGIVKTLADDTIGTGPRLQLHTDDEPGNDAAEMEFRYWSMASMLCEKLHVMRKSKTVDGEAVAKIVNNPPISHPVKLDLQLVECDRLAAPWGQIDTPTYIDGVTLDQYGNPVQYDILDEHPGNAYATSFEEFTPYGRNQIIHYYQADRPEQHRGVSEVVSALPLFAMMRRGTLATLAAFETAANLAMVLKTAGGFQTSDEDVPETWESIPITRNAATVLPEAWELGQVSPEHPSTNYQMFKREILNEVARCICVPYNIAAADSSGYNYASGRLDHQVYDRALKVEQNRIQSQVLDRLLGQWLLEASLLGILPASIAGVVFEAAEYGVDAIAARIPHSWQWDRRPHVDPSKEATAQQTRLKNGTTSRELELREQGLDMDEVDASAAASYGMDVASYRQALFASNMTNGNIPSDAVDEVQDEEEAENVAED